MSLLGAGVWLVSLVFEVKSLGGGPIELSFVATASNTTGGTGTLVVGPATFVLQLLRSDGVTTTTLDTEVVPVRLVEPTLFPKS